MRYGEIRDRGAQSYELSNEYSLHMNVLINHFEEYDRRIFWILAGLCIAAAFSYIYFLSFSVHAVIARRSGEATSEKLMTEIAQLESQYVALDKRIDLALAREEGFVEVSAPRYVSTEEATRSFTLRQ